MAKSRKSYNINENDLNAEILRLIREESSRVIREQAGGVGRIEYDPAHPERITPKITRSITNRTHTFGVNPSFPDSDERHYEEKNAGKRFKDVVERAKRHSGLEKIDMPNYMRLNEEAKQALGMITHLEGPHVKELEKLAAKIVREQYSLGNEVKLQGKLVRAVNNDGFKTKKGNELKIQQPKIDLEDPEIQAEVNDELGKRRMVNAMIQGAAKKAHYSYFMHREEIDAIDPKLMKLYTTLMTVNDLNYWMMDYPGGGDDGEDNSNTPPAVGKVELDTSDPENPIIKAEGMIFPVLLHELSKGVMELMSLHGLPKDKHIAEYVLDKTDILDNEVWDLRFGPGIWDNFVEAIGESDDDVRNHLYHRVVSMPAKEFHNLMRGILSGTHAGKQALVKLANEIKDEFRDYDYEEALRSGEDDDEVGTKPTKSPDPKLPQTDQEIDDYLKDINIDDLFN